LEIRKIIHVDAAFACLHPDKLCRQTSFGCAQCLAELCSAVMNRTDIPVEKAPDERLMPDELAKEHITFAFPEVICAQTDLGIYVTKFDVSEKADEQM